MEEDAIKKHVTLDGGLPWGFRMSGGSDTQMPLTITRVNAGSKAALQGIIEGDRIVSINGQSTNRLTNQEAHDLLKGSGTLLQLELFQKPQSSGTKMSPSKSNDTNQTHTTSGTEGQSAQSDTNTSPAKTSLKTGSPVLSHVYKCNSSKPGTWSPGQSKKLDKDLGLKKEEKDVNHPPPPPVWTPSLRRSSSTERREFRPVRLDTSSLRKQPSTEEDKSHPQDREDPLKTTTASSTAPVVHHPPGPVTKSNSTNSFPGAGVQKRPPSITYKTTASVLSTPVATPTSHLPKVPNPTVTLLKKAREGQLPKGAAYLEPQSPDNNSQSTTVGDSPIRRVDTETNGTLLTTATTGATTTTATLATSTTTAVTNGTSATSTTAPATTGEGAPLPLNSEAKDENYHQWYRRMYESLHRSRNPQGDFVTVRYKANKARGGYLSEPEPCEYDSDYAAFSTLDRRRNGTLKDSDWEAPLSRSFYEQDLSRNQPGRIEDYEPGRSSIVEEEKKKWLEEIMGMFDGVQKQIHIPPKSFTAFALKEAGYESDSHLVYRRKPEGETPSDPGEQKAFYRDIQRGGEVPLHGLRKTVPDKPRENVQESVKLLPVPPPRDSSKSLRIFQKSQSSKAKMSAAENVRRIYNNAKDKKPPLKTASPKAAVAKVKTWRRVRETKQPKVSKPQPEIEEKIAVVSDQEIVQELPQDGHSSSFTCSSPEADETPAARKQDGGGIQRSFSDTSMFEPTANVYLQQRRIVSDSKFRQNEQKVQKLTRYQKLARDTKIFVSKLSGEIPSPEKLRQVLKLAPKAEVSTTKDESPKQTEISNNPKNSVNEESPKDAATEIQKEEKINRFDQLRSLYNSLEKISQLEKKTSSMVDLGPLSSQEVIDYELWQKLRDREKAQKEIRKLSTWIQSAQQNGECHLLPSDSDRHKWRGDSGLRIKMASVDELKEKFQRNYQTLPRSFGVKTLKTVARQSSLTGGQVSSLKSRLNELYANPKRTLVNRKPSGQSSLDSQLTITVTGSEKSQMALRSVSKQTHVLNTATKRTRSEIRREEIASKENSISETPVQASKKGSNLGLNSKPKELTECEKRQLSSQLCFEAKERVSRQKAMLSTKSSIQFSQRDFQSLVSSRDSSMSDQSRDYLLVLTPAKQPNISEVECAVKEWAAKRAPTVPTRSSSLALRDAEDDASLTSASSVQTVIHRDVLDKIKFFESRASQIGDNEDAATRRRAYSFRSVSDMRSRELPKVPKRSQSLPSRKNYALRRNVIGQAKSCVNVNGKSSQSQIFLSDYLPEKSISTIELPNRTRVAPQTFSKAASLTPAKKTSSPSYSCSYLTLVKQGDVSSKRQIFNRQQESQVAENEKLLKDQETGRVGLIKRKYELLKSKTTKRDSKGIFDDLVPSLTKKLNIARKHVSFPSINSDSGSLQQSKLDGNSSKNTGKVKQTLLSSARLAYLQSKNSTTNSDTIKKDPRIANADSLSSAAKLKAVSAKMPENLRISKANAAKDSTSGTINSARSKEPLSSPNMTFDPSLHQPMFRYTPRFEPNSTCDIFGTYPRRRGAPPPRPPLPKSPIAERGPVHRFQESQVTIHYKSPIRKLRSPTGDREIDEEELKHIQAEHMRQVYEQERRRKIIQELEDIESRRHTDNLLPSQKSPIPLNRYDDFVGDKTIRQQKNIETKPEPKTMARALYNFVALNSRELPFHKGDIIYIRRRIDKNWYEGEHNAMVGIFPTNYVEIISNEGTQTMHKNREEGNARVKYNFAAQSPVELSLIKGELVTLSRQIDENWLEGYIGTRKGIFPASYVEILRKPVEKSGTNKPAGHPVSHSLMTNGSLRVNNQRNAPHVQYGRQNQYSSLPVLGISRSGYHTMHSGTVKTAQESPRLEIHNEPILYRVLYPYVPQNEDELELQEGDTVHVLEMCDDGWFVGTCHRTGRFGTFPGNYVQRL